MAGRDAAGGGRGGAGGRWAGGRRALLALARPPVCSSRVSGGRDYPLACQRAEPGKNRGPPSNEPSSSPGRPCPAPPPHQALDGLATATSPTRAKAARPAGLWLHRRRLTFPLIIICVASLRRCFPARLQSHGLHAAPRLRNLSAPSGYERRRCRGVPRPVIPSRGRREGAEPRAKLLESDSVYPRDLC